MRIAAKLDRTGDSGSDAGDTHLFAARIGYLHGPLGVSGPPFKRSAWRGPRSDPRACPFGKTLQVRHYIIRRGHKGELYPAHEEKGANLALQSCVAFLSMAANTGATDHPESLADYLKHFGRCSLPLQCPRAVR